ncbi:MAG: SO_0444 family Cu/Zn efflux transporter [Tenacibaculum sp.]|nr:SO_0444 family Cu/Zn efflux transporter [Tenacibaculum sp.]
MNIIEYISSFFLDFIKILCEMAPFLLLGFFFAGLLYAFVPSKNIERYLNGNPLKSSVLAALFGIPLPLCSCGVIPTGTALYKNGASKGGTVSFLISTPQTGIDSILATFSLMGLPFTIIRPFAALITGVIGGFMTNIVTNKEVEIKSIEKKGKKDKTISEKIQLVFRYGFVDFIQDISKWLIVGVVLAAIISVLIPNNFFELINISPIYQMLAILVVSIPLYICATGSIPLAAMLILKGVSPGAAFVLLMAGPATNAATITMIGRVLGKKSLLIYLSTIIIGAIGFGLLIDYVLPYEWFSEISKNHLYHNHETNLSWWQITSGIILSGLIINGYIRKCIKRNKVNNNKFDMKIIKVEGMTCSHCKSNVENNISKLPFVKNVKVDLVEKTVSVEGEQVEMNKVKEVINSLGYKAE